MQLLCGGAVRYTAMGRESISGRYLGFKFLLNIIKYWRIGDLDYWYLYKYGVIKLLSLGFEIKE